MNVCLDEAGDDRTVSGIDYGVRCLSARANARDTPIGNEQVATHDGVRGIHRDERAVFDED
jgi:hypothetical protein